MAKRRMVVLFDVDGTLITCGGAGRRAMEAAFVDVVGRDDVCGFSFAGSTDRAIARRGLSAGGLDPDEAAIDAFLGRYLEHLDPSLARGEGYAVFAGVEDLLDALAGCTNVAVGLGTGNVEPGAHKKLARGGLSERFDFGGFGSDHEERPRLLEVGAARGAARLGAAREHCRVVVVGDTPRDVSAARAIGAECIAVATGRHDGEELRGLSATLAVDELTDGAVRALLGLSS